MDSVNENQDRSEQKALNAAAFKAFLLKNNTKNNLNLWVRRQNDEDRL